MTEITLKEARDHINRLERRLVDANKSLEWVRQALEEKQAELARLRAALEEYAKPENWRFAHDKDDGLIWISLLGPECAQDALRSNGLPTTIAAVEAEEERQELERAKYLLIHTYLTLSRAEYEDGMTDSELHDAVCAFLWNHQLQPGLPEHHENVRRFLADYQAQSKVTLPTADEILKRMAQNANG